MSTSRYMLRVDQLDAFQKFCEAYGWELKHPKATYEVLRSLANVQERFTGLDCPQTTS